jgi:RNA polymerase sigma factor (TIGR02999 family)
MTPLEIIEFDQRFAAWQDGEDQEASRVIELAYRELRQIARMVFKGQYQDNTLQPTAIANEVCMKILRCGPRRLVDRNHFFATAVLQMRNFIIDYQRTRPVEKRIGQRVAVEEIDLPTRENIVELIDLEAAMKILGSISPRARQVVELRYIAGLSEWETAEALGLSVATIKRDWVFAKGMLAKLLGGSQGKITVRPPQSPKRLRPEEQSTIDFPGPLHEG